MTRIGTPRTVTFTPEDPHAVYRIRDRFGRTIYIGSSHDPAARIAVHRAAADWRHQIDSWACAWYPDQASAREAERTAIRAEDPDHNFHHTELAVVVNRTVMKDRPQVNAEMRAARAARIAQEIAQMTATSEGR